MGKETEERFQSERAALEQLRAEGYRWLEILVLAAPPKMFSKVFVEIDEFLERGLELQGMQAGLRPVLTQDKSAPKELTMFLEDGGTYEIRPSDDECFVERTDLFAWVMQPFPGAGGEGRKRGTMAHKERPEGAR